MAIGPLSWVLVYCADINKMHDFYANVLKLEVKKVRPQIVNFRTGGCTLELMAKLDNGPPALDDKRGWDRNKVLISFHVTDLKAEVAALESRGAKCLSGIRPTVGAPGEPQAGWLAQFMDPEGNIIELCQEALQT